ncbi:MAG: biopolymer transporter ExbD [Phycisphaerales bacterium]|nr:biopolymer transporter ExbD [Phycisphaerales bacterium]NUQ66983.1 biopolymer transporter ExbD [Phycisphaerales bacterium]
MRLNRPRELAEAPFDLTPMVDVVLLLIIFFMLSAQFAETFGSPMNLPGEKGENRAKPEQSIVVDLTREGIVMVGGQQVPVDRLALLVAADIQSFTTKRQTWELVVRADRDCPGSHLNRLAATLAAVGVRSWKLAVAGEGT